MKSIHLLRWLAYLKPWNWFKKKKPAPAQVQQNTCNEWMPMVIQLGHAIAKRPDILSKSINHGLAKFHEMVQEHESRVDTVDAHDAHFEIKADHEIS